MTEPPLTSEQKAAVLDRVRRERERLQPKPKWTETFAKALTWAMEATSALALLRTTDEELSGKFNVVANRILMEHMLEDHENGLHADMPEPSCPMCAEELGGQ